MRNWLKKLRKDSTLRQYELASLIGISQNYYCAIEKGIRQQKLELDLAYKLSQLFDVSLEYIAEQEVKVS